MRRVPVEKRPDSTRLVQSQGLVYCHLGSYSPSQPYWPDDRYYSFTLEEIALLVKASKDVFEMCRKTADYLLQHPDIITQKMAIPPFALKQIKKSWGRQWGGLLGRFDICFGGLNHPDPNLRVPKFYEFNSDTPSTIIEAAEIQWLWLEQTGHGNDQYNSITGSLIESWRHSLTHIEKEIGFQPTVYFSVSKGAVSGEDAMNVMLVMDTCQQAGGTTKAIAMEDICLCPKDGRFYDKQGNHIDVLFKFYPWEFLVEEKYGRACFADMDNIGKRDEEGNYIGGTIWIEPPYNMLWSNKTLWVTMWELFKDDPRSKWLLPTYFDKDASASLTSFARKPIFSREGFDVVLNDNDKVVHDTTRGTYGEEGFVIQELALPPEFKDAQGKSHYPVLGMWVVGGEPAGLGIREDGVPVTTHDSVWIPHSIEDGPVNYQRREIPNKEEIDKAFGAQALADQFDDGAENELVSYIKDIVINEDYCCETCFLKGL